MLSPIIVSAIFASGVLTPFPRVTLAVPKFSVMELVSMKPSASFALVVPSVNITLSRFSSRLPSGLKAPVYLMVTGVAEEPFEPSKLPSLTMVRDAAFPADGRANLPYIAFSPVLAVLIIP